MVAFMREFVPEKNSYLLFDGTALVCNSLNIYEARRGYNSHGCHDPQINLMYAAAITEEKMMPVFYKRFPGSVRDLSAFESVRTEMGAQKYVAINDKGFVTAKDQERMEAIGLHYLQVRGGLRHHRDAQLGDPGGVPVPEPPERDDGVPRLQRPAQEQGAEEVCGGQDAGDLSLGRARRAREVEGAAPARGCVKLQRRPCGEPSPRRRPRP